MNVFSYSSLVLNSGQAVPYFLGTGWYWFKKKIGGGYHTEQPDLETIERNLTPERVGNKPIVINIEAYRWNTGPDGSASQEVRDMITSVVETVRRLHPGNQIGFYGFLPIRDYYAPVRALASNRDDSHFEYYRKMEQWRLTNELNAEWFCPLVDFLCPSIYHLMGDKTDRPWATYAWANINEAAHFGLPVCPFMTPMRRDQHPLPIQEWRQHLRLMDLFGQTGLIDGVYLWAWDRTWTDDHLEALNTILVEPGQKRLRERSAMPEREEVAPVIPIGSESPFVYEQDYDIPLDYPNLPLGSTET